MRPYTKWLSLHVAISKSSLMIHHAHGRSWVDFGQTRSLWLSEDRKEQTFWSIDLNLLSILTFDFLFLWTGLNFELVLNFSNLSSPPLLTIFFLLVSSFIPKGVFDKPKNTLRTISGSVNGSKHHIKHYRAVLYVFDDKIAQKKHFRLSRNKSWNQPFFWVVDFRLVWIWECTLL